MQNNINTPNNVCQDESTPYASSIPLTFTVYTSIAPLGKEFTAVDGEIRKTTHGTMWSGKSATVTMSLPQLKDFIPTMGFNQALGQGLINDDIAHTANNLKIEKLAKLDPTAHHRGKACYSFSTAAGLWLLDYDGDKLTSVDAVMQQMFDLMPELHNVEMLALGSSSNGVYLVSNPEVRITKNGVHIYVAVSDASAIPQLNQLLKYRSWLAGLCDFKAGKASFLPDTFFDHAVSKAEHLIFETRTLGNGVAADARDVKYRAGNVFDVTGVAFITPAQEQELNAIIEKARAAAKGETIKKLRETGHSDAQIKKIVHDMEHRILPHTVELQGRDTGVNTVGDIIAAIQSGTGQKFIDDDWLDIDGHAPIFGRTKLYVNNDNSIVLHSFKNGGTSYTLLGDTSKLDESDFLNNTAAEPEEPAQESTAEPSSNIENFDSNADYQHLDLLQYLDDSHILKRVSQLLHEQTYIPSSSLLMVGLGVVSAYTALSNVVVYRDGKPMPIGLYVVVEQPSGTSKSLSLNTFSEPFSEALAIAHKEAKKAVAGFDISKGKTPEYLDAVAKAARIGSKVPATNATSEAVEKSLIDGDGFFCCAGSEQGLFNSLLGKSYTAAGNVANADIILNGYDGGYMRVLRAGREGFIGKPVGAVTMFAQTGSIDTVVEESKGTGLSERFLCLAEPSALGTRDHTRPYPVNAALITEYATKCKPFSDVAASGEEINFNNLRQLHISADDWLLIAKFKNALEPHLLGKYSHQTLIGAAAKVEQSIMKIASNLHLMGDTPHLNEIDNLHVRAAICITRDILKAFYNLCSVKGICGQSVEIETILNMEAFQNNYKTVTMREIIKSREKRNPFSKMQKKAAAIRATVAEMVGLGILIEVGKEVYRKA